MQLVQQVQDDFFGDNLQTLGEVVVSLSHFLTFGPHRTEFIDQALAMKRFNGGSTFVPFHLDATFMVREVIQVQLKSIPFRSNHATKEIGEFGFAVGS